MVCFRENLCSFSFFPHAQYSAFLELGPFSIIVPLFTTERLPLAPKYSLQVSKRNRPKRTKTKIVRREQTKRIRIRWTKQEEEYLRKGVKKYGKGHWKQIINSYPFNPCRTNADAKDKWRNMKNKSS